ncbi:CU044_2847 family protein [Amycolatopsis sp. lyj-109]|uniref:CU044_2847 family protein n=1 Tax=Amycolatopsis sp. lyj-109 TaxID=2789287 RepID=UPI00397E30B0
MSDPENYRATLARASHDSDDLQTDETSTPRRRSDESIISDNPGALEFVRIEVRPDPSRLGDIGARDVVERFTARVDELGTSIAAVATRLRASLESKLAEERTDRWRMSQVVVEFGLSLEAQTGVVVCQGKTAAAFKVAVTWTERQPDG